MRIEPEGAILTFTARLARENGWSAAHADAVNREYRRFLYLAATGDGPVTPSEDVDQAWHLHLGYSRHYWEILCERILGRPLHHDPTEGGGSALDRHRRQYARTLERYRKVFGSAPPARIWPAPYVRFRARSVRIDADKHLIVGRNAARWCGGALLAAISVAGSSAALANNGGPARDWFGLVMAGISLLFLAFFVVQWARTRSSRNHRDKSSRNDGGCGGAASCGGGDGDGGGGGGGGGCGGD